MELETEYSLKQHDRRTYAWCQMSRSACLTNDNHKMEAWSKLNIQISFFCWGGEHTKYVQKCKKSFMHFTDIDVPTEQVMFMIPTKITKN